MGISISSRFLGVIRGAIDQARAHVEELASNWGVKPEDVTSLESGLLFEHEQEDTMLLSPDNAWVAQRVLDHYLDHYSRQTDESRPAGPRYVTAVRAFQSLFSQVAAGWPRHSLASVSPIENAGRLGEDFRLGSTQLRKAYGPLGDLNPVHRRDVNTRIGALVEENPFGGVRTVNLNDLRMLGNPALKDMRGSVVNAVTAYQSSDPVFGALVTGRLAAEAFEVVQSSLASAVSDWERAEWSMGEGLQAIANLRRFQASHPSVEVAGLDVLEKRAHVQHKVIKARHQRLARVIAQRTPPTFSYKVHDAAKYGTGLLALPTTARVSMSFALR